MDAMTTQPKFPELSLYVGIKYFTLRGISAQKGRIPISRGKIPSAFLLDEEHIGKIPISRDKIEKLRFFFVGHIGKIPISRGKILTASSASISASEISLYAGIK